MNSKYVEWLKEQGIPLFEGGGIYWRLYQGALVPAPASPCFIVINQNDAKTLLKESGAMFIRYASDPCEKETAWWYVICDKHETEKRSAKTRQNVNRGKRNCSVRLLHAEWLAMHGYNCYISAYTRYHNANPDSKEVFRKIILNTMEGPFEYWGVFVKDVLAGYSQCIVDGNDAVTNITKYNPEYLKDRTAYALVDHLISHYIADRKMILSNGNRSIAHDTNYQDVLVSHGFRKQFCNLNVIYQPWLNFTIKSLFPARRVLARLPDRGPIHKLQSLLYQEKLRRACSVR